MSTNLLQYAHMKHLMFLLIFFLILPTVTLAEQEQSDQTRIYLISEDDVVLSSFSPFGETYRGTMDLTVADLGTDGTQEIIVGAGVGLPPSVSVFRQDGSKITDFYAYAQTFIGGVNVSACDVTGDGIAEIITGAGFTGGPHVRIFSSTGEFLDQFFAYDNSFRGGVDVACGDIDGDNVNEVVTAPGLTGGPHIKVFKMDGTMIAERFVGGGQFDNFGARIATGDIEGDGDDDIIVARAGFVDSYILYLESKGGELVNQGGDAPFEEYFNGTDVFSYYAKDDIFADWGFAMRGGNTSQFTTIAPSSSKLWTETHTPFADERDRGLVVDVIDTQDTVTYVVGTTEPQIAGSLEEQYILVDITDQTLRAFQNHSLVKSFLISSGVNSYPTPLGTTTVTDKFLWHDYSWYYGDGDARNYDLPDVKYNLRFRNHYYLHYAYWHNNFGNKMSHGCVNINYENSEWIYNWTDIGATVEVVN